MGKQVVASQTWQGLPHASNLPGQAPENQRSSQNCVGRTRRCSVGMVVWGWWRCRLSPSIQHLACGGATACTQWRQVCSGGKAWSSSPVVATVVVAVDKWSECGAAARLG
eukprot:1332700-Amphidinium_carterae.1